MGWGSADIKCPHCGYEQAEIESHTRRRDFNLFCSKCGYYETRRPIFDRMSKPNNDGDLNFKLKKDGSIIYRLRKMGGYGTIMIRENMGTTGSHLKKMLNDDEVQKLVTKIKTEMPLMTDFCITRWNENSKTIELVAGTFPENWVYPDCQDLSNSYKDDNFPF